MSSLFVYSDKPALACELVALGKQLGLEATVLVFSSDHTEAYRDCGAKGMVVLAGDAELPENNAAPLAAWLSQTENPIILIGATPTGRDLAARIAGYLDCNFAGDISGIELATPGTDAAVVTKHIQYGGAVILEETLGFPAVITVPAGRAEPVHGDTPVLGSELISPDTRLECVGNEPIPKEDIDLASSKRVVGIGMGLAKQEDLALIQNLASSLDAGIGCTRGIAEERHWLSPEQYLGLSGLSISPELYLAVGISGQVQHLAGIRDSKVIVAIDKDENAAIFKAADYGIVGDLYEVVPALIKSLQA